MNCRCVNLVLISLIFAFMARHCWCFSTFQVKGTLEQLALPKVSCSPRRMKAAFGPMVNNVHVKDKSGAKILVPQSWGSCGVRLGREKNQTLSFFSRYDSCYAEIESNKVVILLEVQLTGEDQWFQVKISCPLIQRNSNKNRLIPSPLPGKCDIEKDLRVVCRPQSVSRGECSRVGCCYDVSELTCYYRLNACSLDGHFVFSVKTTDTDLPINPSRLIIKDHPQCTPVVTTPDTAIFKIGLSDCGAISKVDGDVMIYEVEVEERHTKSITKKSPFILQVQCEYKTSDLMRAANLKSSYAVTNPPPVVALGTIRVLMRIAKDESFTSFFPEDQLPLILPLQTAAYVEVSIAQPSPDPTLSLRVRDCFAYPASRHSVWTLLYDGCPNPLDDMRSSIPVDNEGKTNSHSQVWRFDVKTFAFVDPHTSHHSIEEIYFYCLVEICTNDTACAQRCTFISSEGERQKREVVSESDQAQLVSLGPLLLGKDIEPEETQSAKLNASDIVPTLQCWCSHVIDPTVHSMVQYQEEREARRRVCEAQIACNQSQ